jgi:proton-translocating NADH-quinone oxidoreductase chain N
MLLSVLSMALMLSSYDFISMYLAIELQSLSFYVLAASKRDSEFSTEAGLKYFVLGAFSSGILLFGFSLVYGFTGLTNLEELAKLFSGPHELNAVSGPYNWEWEWEWESTGSMTGSMTGPSTLSIPHAVPFSESNGFVLVGLLFLIVGFLFKVSAAPFHMWSPDVYEGSPLFVTAFFATAPKIAILGLFLRLLLFSFYDFLFFWQNITIVCAIISMAFACLAALAQKKIKRLLAFSSITHIGYILTALSCGTVEGLQSLLIYIFIYILMSLNFFSSLLSLRHSLGFNNDFKYISDFRLLSKTNALLALNITVSLFSMVGIPPLAGFWSKFYLFFSALSSSLYTAALIGVLSSVISCFFYIRIVKVMYFENLSTAPLGGSLLKKWVSYEPMDREKSLVIASTFFAILCIFMHLDILFLVTHRAVLNF